MILLHDDRSRLDAAIGRAFGSKDLRRVLKYRLGRNLEDISMASRLPDITFDLLDVAEKEGWLEQLMKALKAERRENADFCQVIDELLAGPSAGRHLTPERLVRLAVVLSDHVDPQVITRCLTATGEEVTELRKHRSLQDFLVMTLMRARQGNRAHELLRALSEHDLPKPANQYVQALMDDDPGAFDRQAAEDAAKAALIWRRYVTRPGILSRTSEFRRVIEQRAVRRALETLEQGLIDWEHRICLVRYPAFDGPDYLVTGFLIGPDLILASAHIFGKQGGGPVPSRPTFLFDYRALSDGTLAEKPVMIRAAEERPLAWSPPAEHGFMLYRIEDPIGEERGWARLARTADPARGDPIVLLHHAGHAGLNPLRMSIGTIEAADHQTLTYRAPTVAGASGAPCLSDQLEVLATHYGRLTDEPDGLRKKGTRVSVILKSLLDQGVSLPDPGSQPPRADRAGIARAIS